MIAITTLWFRFDYNRMQRGNYDFGIWSNLQWKHDMN